MTSTAPRPLPARLASLDAYRGFVMILMMGEVLRLGEVAAALPTSAFWFFAAAHQEHVPWVGGSLHDLIQPSFSFLVGVALPFSVASRLAAGQSRGRLLVHALVRAFVLVILGIWLRSVGKPQTYFTFEDTLTQIGLGYPFLFLIGLRPRREQWVALVLVLFGYWAAFALYPSPSSTFDWGAVGVPADWPHHPNGFATHWDKNSNLAWAFDTWFLNLFPREHPFLFNGGGYCTLNFVPTLGTMILGLLAGGVLRAENRLGSRVRWLTAAGVVGIALGWLMGAIGLCPVVKRIWTPSFTVWSGGICLLFLAAFYEVIDVRGRREWAFPLIVVGMNSMAAYAMDHLFVPFILQDLRTHLGRAWLHALGDPYAPLLEGAAVLLTLWLILLWMYRRRIFLRI